MGRSYRIDHATLTDVARAAGVSRATAARALGGYGSASAEARERVEAAAAALRYQPNAVARSMITGTTGTLGAVISDIELGFFAQAVRGITDAANAEGFEVIVANTDEDPVKERAAVRVLVSKRVDGLIVAPAAPADTAHLEDALDRGVPVVLFDRGSASPRFDSVVVDNERAARKAVNLLIRLGHRRIAILIEGATAWSATELLARPMPRGVMTSALREAGWAAALRAAHIPVTDALIRRSSYDRQQASAAAAAALAEPDPPTAFLATDEIMTLGTMDAVLGAGLRIPEDVSLVGFDDVPWTTLVRPPLTVVAQPVRELGATATQRVLERIAGADGPPEEVVLRTSLINRGSTGPAPVARGGGPGRA
jgi:LacI family transcriptional regulator